MLEDRSIQRFFAAKEHCYLVFSRCETKGYNTHGLRLDAVVLAPFAKQLQFQAAWLSRASRFFVVQGTRCNTGVFL